jgi:hypothetical protein
MFTPPEGADIHYWIEPQAHSKTDAREGKFSRADICWLNMEQEGLLPFQYVAEHQAGQADYWGPGHYFIHADGMVIGMVSRDNSAWYAYKDYLPPLGEGKRDCVGDHLPTREDAARALWVAHKGKAS